MNKSKEKSRTYNSITNSLFGIFSAIITVILNFIVRVIIVKALGEEINGLHNLFQNTLNVLTLMETGIITAMIIHLYKPVKDKDKDTIKALMSFYKKIYIIIAFAFIILGIIVDIFILDKIVKTSISMKMVRIYFFIFAFSFFLNYLTYFKRSILYAEQKNRISMMATTIGEIIFRSIAIIVSIITHEYLFFLILLVLEKVFSNIICIIYVNKHHPYLKSLKNIKLEKKKQKSIFNTIKPLFINQIANTVQNSSNSILISILMDNIAVVGYYGNYQLVISTIQLLFSQLGGAITSSFGNLSADEDKKSMYNAYKKTCFVIDTLAIICCTLFIICIQNFIEFIFGSNFLLKISSVIILVFNLYIYLLNIPIISVQNAMGLHNKDCGYMIFQAILAIILGYFCGKYWGMDGIFIGLTIPTIIFTLINKGIIISKVAFDVSAKKYILDITKDIVKGICISLIVYFICSYIVTRYLLINIILKAISGLIISSILIIILSYKNKYFHEILEMLKIRKRLIMK